MSVCRLGRSTPLSRRQSNLASGLGFVALSITKASRTISCTQTKGTSWLPSDENAICILACCVVAFQNSSCQDESCFGLDKAKAA